jgi:hypothetical protein
MFEREWLAGKRIPGRAAGLLEQTAAQWHRDPDGHELVDLASLLLSDQAGYLTGEMVPQDGEAHLRGSGAEDLLQWTDAQRENSALRGQKINASTSQQALHGGPLERSAKRR